MTLESVDPEAFLAAVHDDRELQFLFVDDGSTDDTATVLERLVSRQPDSLSYLKRPINAGKAEAVRQGVRSALTMCAARRSGWSTPSSPPRSS